MKNFFKALSLAVVAAFVLVSCQKEETAEPAADMPISKKIWQRKVDLNNLTSSKKGVYHSEDQNHIRTIKVGGEYYAALKIQTAAGTYKYFMLQNLRNKPANMSGIFFTTTNQDWQPTGRSTNGRLPTHWPIH